ncbi:MAG: alpha/beta hydrolase [Propionibacteriaceae bacterium]|nr:alpha/beta hydrolase [Propionibacteriaceae bacterium]
MTKKLLAALNGVVFLYVLVQALRCRIALKNARSRLSAYRCRTVTLSYGEMTYVDEGLGEVVLCSHGLFGGYDQAFETCRNRTASNRVIAPSRFGYLGSDVSGDGSPREQAAAFVELLDALEIDRAYVLGTSAGGTAAIRFALDYPDRTRGLILYCSAPPLTSKPEKYRAYQGPPKLLISNWGMFLTSPLFKLTMGMEPRTIEGMLPVDQRRRGVLLDATVNNPDMATNFDDYPIEELQVPTLILHARDDKLVNFSDMERAVKRFPDATFVAFESGGHLMTGHETQIDQALDGFQDST